MVVVVGSVVVAAVMTPSALWLTVTTWTVRATLLTKTTVAYMQCVCSVCTRNSMQ
jgi:Sec-independent protein secretion pathway component TatC